MSRLHKMLYVLVKKFQAASDGHAHASVVIPDEYWGVLYGRCRALKQFMETAQTAGLVRVAPGGKYILSKRLLAEYDYSLMRKQNPIAIYENEAGPKPAVKAAVKETLDTIDSVTPQDIAHYMFDDEMLATARQRDIHAGEELGENFISEADAYPYFLEPEKAPKKVKSSGLGVLLIHGLLSSPQELREYGEELRQQGHTVLGMRLPGHATSHWDLHDKRYGHWFAAVLRNYEILLAECEKVAVVGFSTGAAVAIKFISEQPINCVGFVSVSAPVGLRDPNTKYVPLVSGLNRIVNRFTKYRGVKCMYHNDGDHPTHNYSSVPVNAIGELLRAARYAKRSVRKITVPTLVVQARDDSVIKPESAQVYYNRLNVKDKELVWIESDWHGIITRDVAPTRQKISEFLARVAKDEK